MQTGDEGSEPIIDHAWAAAATERLHARLTPIKVLGKMRCVVGGPSKGQGCMLPPLTAEGVLPPGVHLAPVTEIIALFGSHNAVRRDMAQRLQRILALAHGTGHLRRVFV